MGFMGFSMQKWIYTMRPRKPFSMERKGSFTKVPLYDRNFKLQYSKNKGGYNFGILLLIISVTLVLFAWPRWMDEARSHNEELISIRESNNNQAFNFLMSSGKKRFINRNYEGALSEFKLAIALKPDDIEVNQLMLEVVSLLCEKNENYCKEFNKLKF